MKVKEAVLAAKEFIAETFADEDPTHIGLEEVEFVEQSGVWRVTVGFSRPWQTRTGAMLLAAGVPITRSYKIVTVKDTDGQVLSIRDRVVNNAA